MSAAFCPWCYDDEEERQDAHECDVVATARGWRCPRCKLTLARAPWARAMVWVAERHGYDESEYGPDVARALGAVDVNPDEGAADR